MEWSKENILEFIDLYKETTVLWDPRDPFHYNKVKKNEAWEDIAREIGRSADECRRKMEYLLAALRREKMKIKSSLLKGKDHKITWFAFDSLKFLLEERRPRKGTEVVPISDVTFREVDERDFDDDSSIYKHGHDYADNFNKTGTPAQSEQQAPAFKRARLDESSGGGKGDSGAPVGHFANYISAKLESYSARTRAAVEHAISNLLFVADLGQFDYLGQLPREKGNGGGGNGGGGSGPPQRTNTNSNAQQQRSQSSTPVPAAPGPRSSKVTRASAAAAAAAASSSQQAEHEVSVSQTQSYQELFDSNNFEDDDAIEKKEMEEGGSQQVEIIVA
ncbi:hypothetical protein LSTR_LSTR009144 [Laodelphax striatellus]|uniref:MADF domain-containing protein n=1 Tax=Laodelphax striatellus TaxID=195883 RepID=A0A482XSI9_LAOST|nr:hypothetical protein LSTR_LSTR009144 [Laodelphax striatellus]